MQFNYSTPIFFEALIFVFNEFFIFKVELINFLIKIVLRLFSFQIKAYFCLHKRSNPEKEGSGAKGAVFPELPEILLPFAIVLLLF